MGTIRLDYGDLQKIVTESVNSVLKDFSKEKMKGARFTNPISCFMKHPLTEGLVRTYPTETTVRYIKEYFKLSDDEIYVIDDAYNDREQIAIKVPIIGNNLELVKKAFALCGWYLGYPKEENLKPNTLYELQFEKKYEEDISQNLRTHETILFHITPTYNIGKIRHIGLTPKAKNSMFDYPSRIYFILGSAKTMIKYLAQQLSDANLSKGNDGKYSIITFDISRIPNRVKFFLDGNSRASVYTYDNIPPNTIEDITEINAN